MAAWGRAFNQAVDHGLRYIAVPWWWASTVGLEWYPAPRTPDDRMLCGVVFRCELSQADYWCLLDIAHDGDHGFEEARLCAVSTVDMGFAPEFDGECEMEALDVSGRRR